MINALDDVSTALNSALFSQFYCLATMYLLRDLSLLYEAGYLSELAVRICSAMGRSLEDLDSCIVSVLIIRKIYNL